MSAIAIMLSFTGACDTGTDTDDGPIVGAPDAGPRGDAAPGAGNLAFMAECQADDQCTTGLCFDFNMKGARCTHTCEKDEDCEAPSDGCNKKGVCRAPKN